MARLAGVGTFRTELVGALFWVGAAAATAFTLGWILLMALKLWSMAGDPNDALSGLAWWLHGGIAASGVAAAGACVLGYRRWRRANPLPGPLPRHRPAFWLLVAGTVGHAVGGAMVLPLALWPGLGTFSILSGDEVAPGRELVWGLLIYVVFVTAAVGFPAASALALVRARRQPRVASVVAFVCAVWMPIGILHLVAGLLLKQARVEH